MSVRHLRLGLLAVGLVVVAMVAWSVLTHAPPKTDAAGPTADVKQGIVVQRDAPSTTLHEGDVEKSRATGSRMELDKFGKQVWKDFDLSHQLDDGRTVRVKADSAAFDPRTNDFEVTGHVEVTTSDGYRLAGNSLSHKADKNKKQDVYESQEPMEFARPDLSGRAGKLRADLATRTYDMWDGVTFTVARGEGKENVTVEGPRVVHDDVQRHGKFPEGATVRQEGGELTARVLEVTLRPKDEKGIKTILAQGDVVATQRTASRGEGAGVRGAMAGLQTLKADAVNVEYGPDGRDVERVLALRGMGPASFDVAPADAAEGPRHLEADALEVLYAAGAPARVVADGSVRLVVMPAGGAPGRTVTSHRAEADLKDGDVDVLAFAGSVAIEEGIRTGKGDRARYEKATETMVLSTEPGAKGGKAEVVEGDSILKALTITSRRTEDLLLADGEVELTYVERQGGGKPKGLEGLAGRSEDPVKVLAHHMKSRTKAGESVFEGDVRLWKGKTVIEAPLVTVSQEGRELLAERGAKAVMEQTAADGSAKDPVRIEAWKLLLDDGRHRIVCEPGAGLVKIRQGDSVITGKDATFELDPDTSSVRRGVVRREVSVADGKRQGTGEEVTFDAEPGRRVVLRGSDTVPARLEMAGRGSTRGEELIFYLDEDVVSVAGGRIDTTIEIGVGGALAGGDAIRP